MFITILCKIFLLEIILSTRSCISRIVLKRSNFVFPTSYSRKNQAAKLKTSLWMTASWLDLQSWPFTSTPHNIYRIPFLNYFFNFFGSCRVAAKETSSSKSTEILSFIKIEPLLNPKRNLCHRQSINSLSKFYSVNGLPIDSLSQQNLFFQQTILNELQEHFIAVECWQKVWFLLLGSPAQKPTCKLLRPEKLVIVIVAISLALKQSLILASNIDQSEFRSGNFYSRPKFCSGKKTTKHSYFFLMTSYLRCQYVEAYFLYV